MKCVGIIPARLLSTRLPKKLIHVVAGKTILEWTYRNAQKSKKLDTLIIACDSPRIYDLASGFGATVCMTSSNHTSGTDRIAEVAKDVEADVVINIQADEPLIHYTLIDNLIYYLQAHNDVPMATVIIPLKNKNDVHNTSVVKVVIDVNQRALYFSRSPIPFIRDEKDMVTYYKHCGLYAYRKSFLETFTQLPISSLENAEKLEQLRVLEAGYSIKTIIGTHDSIGIDTQKDLIAFTEIIQNNRDHSR